MSNIIVVDLDNTLVDLYSPWIEWYNKESGDSLEVSKVRTYNIQNHVKPDWKDRIYEFFDIPERYSSSVEPFAGAAQVMQDLKEFGFDIVVATATAGNTAGEKYKLAKKVMPWLKQSNVMIGARKELLYCDFFIDDAPKNIVKHKQFWKRYGSPTKYATIEWPYNTYELSNRYGDPKKIDLIAPSYNSSWQAWNSIKQFIISYSI